MPSVTTQGIVLRFANYREHDRMLTILSPDSAGSTRFPGAVGGPKVLCCLSASFSSAANLSSTKVTITLS